MRVSRFFIDVSCIDERAGRILISSPEQTKQMRAVLRLRRGDRVDLLDGKGDLYRCVIATSDNSNERRSSSMPLECTIVSKEQAAGEASINLVVGLPVLRNARFEWAIEKLTELGVKRIVPIILARSVVKPEPAETRTDGAPGEGKLSTRATRWMTIAREAAEQCERALIPDVVGAESFDVFVKRPFGDGATKLISAERMNAPSIADAIGDTLDSKNICIAIGAEGGFTPDEVALSFTHGFRPVSLGARILRAETAAVYCASVLISHLDR